MSKLSAKQKAVRQAQREKDLAERMRGVVDVRVGTVIIRHDPTKRKDAYYEKHIEILGLTKNGCLRVSYPGPEGEREIVIYKQNFYRFFVECNGIKVYSYVSKEGEGEPIAQVKVAGGIPAYKLAKQEGCR